MKVCRIFEYCWGHRLVNYEGSKCKYLHGHNWKIEVELDGPQFNDMVIDFIELKEKLDPVLGEFDHTLVLYENDPLVPILKATHEKFSIVSFNPTAENFALYFLKQVQQIYPVHKVKIRVWESSKSFAEAE